MGVSSFEATLKQRCSTCSLRELCLPLGLDAQELLKLDELVNRRRRVFAGQHLYRAGDRFQALTAVRVGFFKTYEASKGGQEYITAFPMTGEIMGLDAISGGVHQGNALALEDSEVCEIPFTRLESLLCDLPRLQRQFHKLLSGTIANDHSLMVVLGTLPAELKVAAFLLSLADRLEARGATSSTVHLPMSREEIGNYLGLKLETVSRMFSKLRDDGLISNEGRKTTIRDHARLKALVLREGAR